MIHILIMAAAYTVPLIIGYFAISYGYAWLGIPGAILIIALLSR